MIKTFEEAVKFLESYIPPPEKKHPGSLGLERMKYLMNLLENPQDSYPTIHVGGTSGKGSTGTIIASILATKYKVGLHTSPHLLKITERIKIFNNLKAQSSKLKATAQSSKLEKNGADISENDFVDLVNEIIPFIRVTERTEFGPPSYFEIVTAMSFLHFKKQKVNMAVIEVGMGGRYDATNVIKPQVAVITNVGLDHTEVLGDTVEKIAEDKAGIIKPGVSVVTGVKQSSVISIIKAKGKRQKAKVLFLGEDFKYKIKKIDSSGCVFDYFGDTAIRNLHLTLLGRHQVENAVIALRTVELIQGGRTLPGKVRPLKEKDIRKGLATAYIPGRLEIVSRKPLVILDGAHNGEKMKALVEAIKDIFQGKKITAIIAIKSGKNARKMLTELLPICHKLILTKFRLTTDLGDTFSYEPSELLKMLKQVQHDTIVINDPITAVKEAIKNAHQDDIILVTGSLYLLGEIRKFLIPNF